MRKFFVWSGRRFFSYLVIFLTKNSRLCVVSYRLLYKKYSGGELPCLNGFFSGKNLTYSATLLLFVLVISG